MTIDVGGAMPGVIRAALSSAVKIDLVGGVVKAGACAPVLYRQLFAEKKLKGRAP